MGDVKLSLQLSKKIEDNQTIECEIEVSDYFSICGQVIDKNGELVRGGQIVEEIAEHFPEIRKYLPMHLSNLEGKPLYFIENGIYHIKNSSGDVAMEYLRITGQEYLILKDVAGDVLKFYKMLEELGIMERWQAEADEFIAFLEKKTGRKISR